jgi:hypothetical protein
MALAIVYRFHIALRGEASARRDLLLLSTRIARQIRSAQREELVDLNRHQRLLTNAVIAYNTWSCIKQSSAAAPLADLSVPTEEVLAHVAPIGFRHINFQGVYRFALDRYLDRLIPSARHPDQPAKYRALTDLRMIEPDL